MATMTKRGTLKAYRPFDDDYDVWGSWKTSAVSNYKNVVKKIAYRVDAPGPYPITAAALNISIKQLFADITTYTFTVGIYDTDPTVGGTPLKTQTLTSVGNQTHTFEFTALSIGEAIPYNTLYFLLTFTWSATEEHLVNDPPLSLCANYAEFTMTVPALSVGVTPSSLYAGDRITADFTNRIGETLNVRIYYNTTLLSETTASSDSLVILCPESWFSTAGVSGNSMSVKLRASDENGRTSNDASFTLQRPTAGTINLTAPRSTTLDGTASINFAWSYSGDGSLTGTDLQWSRDNAVWTDLATISGSGTTWTAPAVSFPGGTIYWRGRVTNSFGLTSAWSGSVSFTVNYSAVSQTIPVNSPTSGIISAARNRTFQIALEASAPVYEPFTVASATFRWRAGESGTYTALTMTPSGNTASVTIPGGTFPSGTIQWYAEATDNTGRTTATAVYTLTAQVSDIEATPLSPINVVVSGDSPIVFRWAYGSIDGTEQRSASIQTRTDDTDWADFATIQGTATSYTAPAGSLPGGRIYWRVRSYNTAAISRPGAWSAPVSFNVFSAPQVLAVSGDGKPFLTISWQVSGQLAYKIEVDGKLYGPYYGPDVRSYTLPEPLADGLHTVRVAAQNEYTLWSPWLEANISVENVPGPEVWVLESAEPGGLYWPFSKETPIIIRQPADIRSTIGASFSVALKSTLSYAWQGIKFRWYQRTGPTAPWSAISGSASATHTIIATEEMSGYQFYCHVYSSYNIGEINSRVATFTYGEPLERWNAIEGEFRADTGYFLIFRNGKLIGKTYEHDFTDRAAIGTNEYYVIQVLQNGYYTKSNIVTRIDNVDCPEIALLSGGDFLRLELSENADRTQAITKTGEVAYVQYSGATYPEAEIGEAESLTAPGDVSFTAAQEADARRFEAMLKKPVIYKIPGGDVTVGVLQGFSRKDPRFFKAYTFSVTRMDWRDYVEP